MPARRRAANVKPGEALARGCRCRAAPLDVPRRCAGIDAGSALDREALDTGTVASGAKIKPGARIKARRPMAAFRLRPRQRPTFLLGCVPVAAMFGFS
jgi:hypothetical protein